MRRDFIMKKHLPLFVLLIGFAVFSPAHSQAAGHNGPPPEAFSACNGKTGGASCNMRTPHGIMNGTCGLPRGQNDIVCMPSNMRQNGSRPQTGRHDPSVQGGGQRQMRQHTTTQSSGIKNLYPATQEPITNSHYSSVIQGDWRIITSNAIANHKTGAFPNPGNPNSISKQAFTVHVPKNPKLSNGTVTQIKIPGWALNGVPFDPGAGEFYKGNRSSGWQYEALSGAIALGLDVNHAHVQPSGKYHYHGLPSLFMNKLGVRPDKHSPQIGWAVDGFPIYALYGYKNSKPVNAGTKKLTPSYRIKSGQRPSGANQPGGTYDGTFVADYEYVMGSGDLDECNGRWTITPEYPDGTYAYFLTQTYPVVPRCVKGENVVNERGHP